MNLINGTLIVGQLLGYEEKPWTTDPTKFNRRIGIKTGEYDSGFGIMDPQVVSVDIQADSVEKIKNQVKDLTGTRVVVQAVFRASKGGKNGAFLSCFMPKEAGIQQVK